jgi:PleD family two-component response regulator
MEKNETSSSKKPGGEFESLLQEDHSSKKKKKCILIVDDIHANVFLVESILTGDYFVLKAETASEMWRILRASPPDLILLDLMMPFESGFEILPKLKHDPLLTGIPVIVISARDSRDDVLKAMSLGARDYIVKPVTEDVLLTKISAILG